MIVRDYISNCYLYSWLLRALIGTGCQIRRKKALGRALVTTRLKIIYIKIG